MSSTAPTCAPAPAAAAAATGPPTKRARTGNELPDEFLPCTACGMVSQTHIRCSSCERYLLVEKAVVCACVPACIAIYCDAKCADVRPLGRICCMDINAKPNPTPLCSSMRLAFYCEVPASEDAVLCTICAQMSCRSHSLYWTRRTNGDIVCGECDDRVWKLLRANPKPTDADWKALNLKAPELRDTIDIHKQRDSSARAHRCAACETVGANCCAKCGRINPSVACGCYKYCRARYCSVKCRGLQVPTPACACVTDPDAIARAKSEIPACFNCRVHHLRTTRMFTCRACLTEFCDMGCPLVSDTASRTNDFCNACTDPVFKALATAMKAAIARAQPVTTEGSHDASSSSAAKNDESVISVTAAAATAVAGTPTAAMQ